MNKEARRLSLYACRKWMPIVNAAKIAGFLGIIFFQTATTRIPMLLCGAFTLMMLTTDTYLKLRMWKCPACQKVLPSDFYSRKTMTRCPVCEARLNFSDTRFLVPVSELLNEENETQE